MMVSFKELLGVVRGQNYCFLVKKIVLSCTNTERTDTLHIVIFIMRDHFTLNEMNVVFKKVISNL